MAVKYEVVFYMSREYVIIITECHFFINLVWHIGGELSNWWMQDITAK